MVKNSKNKNKKNKKQIKPTRVSNEKQIVPANSRMMRSSACGSVVITHRELVRQFTHNGAFSTASLPINAGNKRCFSWLGPVARNWELYRFLNLTFELVPGNPTTCTGRAYLAIDCDTIDPDPLTAETMMSNAASASGPAWGFVSVKLPDSRKVKLFMMTTESTYSERGAAMVDAGKIIFGAYTTTTCYWDLYASYTVELSVPQVEEVHPSTYFQGSSGPATNYSLVNPDYVETSLMTDPSVTWNNETDRLTIAPHTFWLANGNEKHTTTDVSNVSWVLGTGCTQKEVSLNYPAGNMVAEVTAISNPTSGWRNIYPRISYTGGAIEDWLITLEQVSEDLYNAFTPW
jgi:hypothetical protein